MLRTRRDRLPAVVPYITAWSSEDYPPFLVVARNGGIGYADEHPSDRDPRGILWDRVSHSPGVGRPEFGRVHFGRHHHAMRQLLCQNCGRPADTNEHGTLWLLLGDARKEGPWPTDLVTPHPPVCLHCAELSVRACPHLRGNYVALRVRTHVLAGAEGVVYRPDRPLPVPERVAALSFDDPRIRWMRATQLVMRLDDYVEVDLRDELAAGGIP